MKLMLIKLGKAFVAIKRDGLIVGGRRVLNYLLVFLKAVTNFKSGDVLIITGGVGDSANYRSFNQAEELNYHGIRSEVTIQDNPLLPRLAGKFNIFIFHRTLYTGAVAKLIGKIKEQGKEIIFETDDLVFDARFVHATDFYKQISYFEKKQYEKGVGEEILKDPYVNVCTTTTSYLAEKLKEYGKKVFIVPNKLSKKDLEIAEEILKLKAHEVEKSIKLGYFSGTISHNKDFAVITDALLAVMEKYPQAELYLVGPLDVESKLNTFKERIKQLPFVPRDKHFENNAKVDINLAPLEIGNPFCEAKSELKFFEAGIVGTPTVASATGTFKETIADGVDGFVAGNTEEWIEKLEKLIVNPQLRSEMGQKARQKSLERYSTQTAKNDEYYNYLKSKINS